MVSTDLDTLERLVEVTGVGRLNGPYAHTVFVKPQWRWRLNVQADVYALITTIRPLMGARRGAKIDELVRAYPEGGLNAKAPIGGTKTNPRKRGVRHDAAIQVAAALGSSGLTDEERLSLQEVLSSLRR